MGLVQTVAIGGLVLVVIHFLVDTFVTAGWSYMNKRVVIDGQTKLEDFWPGARKYFLRLFGGRIAVGIIMLIPIATLITALAASILTLEIGPLTFPEGPLPETLIGLLGPRMLGLLGIVAIVGLVEFLLYIFLLPWVQALVLDDLGIWASIKMSLGFVRRNLATMFGYVAMAVVAWIAASWVASIITPSFPYSELTQPSIYRSSTRLMELVLQPGSIFSSVVSAVLTAFFTLLLFLIYADRTRGLIASAGTGGLVTTPGPQNVQQTAAPPRQVRRGVRYCINCGAPIILVAVFCPNCGARQPPLPVG